jgi:hypothetical protein
LHFLNTFRGGFQKNSYFLWDDRFIKKSRVNFILGKVVVNIKPYKKEVSQVLLVGEPAAVAEDLTDSERSLYPVANTDAL